MRGGCPFGAVMIGISIYEDAIRAVRVKKTGNKLILRDRAESPLFEHTIINGDLVDEKGFATALEALKEDMEISPDEDIHIGLPSTLFKIESRYIKADVESAESFVDNLGLSKDFHVQPFFVSGSYKVETEQFERYGLSKEEIERRIQKQFDTQNGEEEEADKTPPYTMVKAVSFVAILQAHLDSYLTQFKDAGLRVCTIEPNALAYVSYLRTDAVQPFMFVDIDMDYTSFIIFSEKTGVFMLNGADLGIENLESQPNPDEEPLINRGTVEKFVGKVCLANDFFREDSLSKKEEVQQIVFLSNDFEYLIDETENVITTKEIAVAESMLPAILSNKGLEGMPPEELCMYYAPICLADNEDMDFNITENIARNIETNLLSEDDRELLIFKTMKTYMMRTSYALATAAAVYFATIIGTNVFNIIQAGYLQETPSEIVEKYEEAKTNGDVLKTNIAKYNAIAKARTPISPTIDKAISVKPPDIYLTSLSISGKNSNTRKLVMEGVTEKNDSVQKFIDGLVNIPGMEKSRILSQQVKNGKIAVQIVVPLTVGGGSTAERDEKRSK